MFSKPLYKIIVREEPMNMVNVYNEKCFFVINGPVLSNLKDLQRALSYMSDFQYSYHANKDKNDFAVWVRDALKDKECARRLIASQNAGDAARAVEKRLKDYQK